MCLFWSQHQQTRKNITLFYIVVPLKYIQTTSSPWLLLCKKNSTKHKKKKLNNPFQVQRFTNSVSPSACIEGKLKTPQDLKHSFTHKEKHNSQYTKSLTSSILYTSAEDNPVQPSKTRVHIGPAASIFTLTHTHCIHRFVNNLYISQMALIDQRSLPKVYPADNPSPFQTPTVLRLLWVAGVYTPSAWQRRKLTSRCSWLLHTKG